jgi:hypothetical protein
MCSARRALNSRKVWGNTKNKRSAISLYQDAMRVSAKQLWRAVEAFDCRYSEMKPAVGRPKEALGNYVSGKETASESLQGPQEMDEESPRNTSPRSHLRGLGVTNMEKLGQGSTGPESVIIRLLHFLHPCPNLLYSLSRQPVTPV